MQSCSDTICSYFLKLQCHTQTVICMILEWWTLKLALLAGGATALIAASVPNPLPIWAGYSIVLVVLIDSLIMLIVGLLVNNSWRGKRYPTYWW
jgi:CBS-domain-containing membrane protein